MEPLLSPFAADFTLFGGADAVLLIHGFTGSPAHMLPLGKALQEAGFTVRGIRLKGHGTNIGEMLEASSEDWLAEVRESFDSLASAFRSVSIAGLSMGGVLSLILAQERNPSCCVTLSAPMAVKNPLSFAAPALGKFLPVLKKRNQAGRNQLDPDYDIGYDEIPTARVADLNRLIRTAKKGLPAIRCPLMCVQSLKDGSIAGNSADIIQQGAASAVKEKLILKESHHVITIGPETGTLFPSVCRFICQSVKETP